MDMQWLFFWRNRRETDPLLKDKQALVKEIRAAQCDWQHALNRLDHVSGSDQIDYAIFALEAAEKRYEMLLKNAKRMNVHVLDVGMGRAAEG